jgi:hypothetical protein
LLQIHNGFNDKWYCYTEAIKFVQTSKKKLMFKKEDDKEFEEPDYGEDKDRLEEEQEKVTEELDKRRSNESSFLIWG